MENAWAVYLALLSWIFFYVKEYDSLTKRSHRFLIWLTGISLAGLSIFTLMVTVVFVYWV